MQPLPITKKDGQFTLTQIWRDASWAIYEKTNPNHSKSTFEVVKIRIAQPKSLPSGSHLPLRENYPSDSDWGKYGWTASSRPQADSILARELSRPSQDPK